MPKRVIKCQKIQDDGNFDKNLWHVNGLKNIDGVSFYANAIVQCMFNSPFIRQELMKSTDDPKNALTVLLRTYIGRNSNLDVSLVRQFIGEPFSGKRQQDASELLMSICSKFNLIRNSIEHILNIKNRCQVCQYTVTESHPNNVLLLTLPKITKALTLQEIIAYSLSQWNSIEGRCNSCGASNKLMNNINISTCNKVLVLQLVLKYLDKNTLQFSKISYNIKTVPTTTISLCGKKYKVRSAVFHDGVDFYGGHYTSMLRFCLTSWILVDDVKVEKKISLEMVKKVTCIF